jgi:HEAT repeats
MIAGLFKVVGNRARLGSLLSPDALRRLLRHAHPGIRADACRCARPLPELISILIDLLDDLDRRVVTSAGFALGRMGRIESRRILKTLLQDDPSEDVIDAVSSIADEECLVLLGRIARSGSVLADAALNSLENVEDDRAVTIAGAILRSSRHRSCWCRSGVRTSSSASPSRKRPPTRSMTTFRCNDGRIQRSSPRSVAFSFMC